MKLQSGKVTLRPFRKEDASRLVALANNQKVANNMRDGFPHPYTLEDAEKFITNCLELDPITRFAIEYDGEYVGNIGLTRKSNVYRNSAEIGYFIGEPYWNKGIATEAVNLITDYGFRELGIVRIHTGIFEFNPASGRVLEKCGYRQDGRFEKAITKKGQLWDEIRYSKINPEFTDE